MNVYEQYLNTAVQNVVNFAPRFFGAIILVVVGFWLIKRMTKYLVKKLNQTDFSPEIIAFLGNISNIGLKILILISAAGIAGFDTSAVVGMLAAAGFAIGLALQGGLGNFASGIIILLFKPYRVGDWIDLTGKFGKVEEIDIFSTILISPGNKTLIIPNSQITSNIVTNFSKKGKVRLELKINMPYEESFPKVKGIISNALSHSKYVLEKHDPIIGINVFDTHFISVDIKMFIHPDNYWDAYYETNALIKSALSENNIKVPYPEDITLGNIGE